MFDFLLGIIGNLVAALGENISQEVKYKLFPDENLVEYLPRLYYKVFTETIENYAQNPANNTEIAVLQQFESLKYWDGEEIERKKALLIQLLKEASKDYKNTENSLESPLFIALLAKHFIEKGVIVAVSIPELTQILQNALQKFPAHFFNKLTVSQGNYLILQEVYNLGNILPKEDFFLPHFDLFHQKLDILLARTPPKTLEKLFITVFAPTKTQIQDTNLAEMYGETALEWKPYGDKNIAELIASFQQAYPLYTLELQAFPANLELDVAEIAEWKCKKSHQLIILDINLLAIHSQVSTILDDCHVGGIIIPYFPFKDSGLNDKLDSYKNKYLPHLMLYKSLPRFGLRKEIQTNVFESELFDKIDMIASECLQVVKHTGKTSSKDFSF